MSKNSERIMPSDEGAATPARVARGVPDDSRTLLDELVRTRMPFGRFAGRYLLDLPEPYVVWFCRNQELHGRLGFLLASLLEIKINGLEQLLRPLRPPDER